MAGILSGSAALETLVGRPGRPGQGVRAQAREEALLDALRAPGSAKARGRTRAAAPSGTSSASASASPRSTRSTTTASSRAWAVRPPASFGSWNGSEALPVSGLQRTGTACWAWGSTTPECLGTIGGTAGRPQGTHAPGLMMGHESPEARVRARRSRVLGAGPRPVKRCWCWTPTWLKWGAKPL